MSKFYIEDLETGCRVEVSEQEYIDYQKILLTFRPKLNIRKGQILIVGTSNDLESNQCLSKLFYQPENFKHDTSKDRSRQPKHYWPTSHNDADNIPQVHPGRTEHTPDAE